MANTSRPMGLKPRNIKDAETNQYVVTAAQVIVAGDVVSLDSAGTVIIGDSLPIGVAASNMVDSVDGSIKATAEAGDTISIWDDPNEVFVGQISTFAATDPYTTSSSAACYDIAGATGVQYIDAAATSNDTFKIKRLSWEENGKKSIAGAYAKVECRFNNLKHVYGVIA